ncbi:hypothetical protein [Nocardia nepalensis]|uniref:hypothetical protein n=1 Tax=Nocardia nepalensis TaxID=3375448 RepID=UPI003B67D3C6
MTMILPPLFLLSLAVAQPVSATPPDGAAAVALPWEPSATAPPDGVRPDASEVVFGECTGSSCSARMPDPPRLAPLVVAPDALRVDAAPDAPRVNVAPDALRINVAPDALRVKAAPAALPANATPDALRVNVTPDPLRVKEAPAALRVTPTPDALRVNVTPDALRLDLVPDVLRVDLAPNLVRVDGALELRSADSPQGPISGDGATLLPTDIARREGSGSASSLPRVVGDLLSRLLDLVQQVPLPLPR